LEQDTRRFVLNREELTKQIESSFQYAGPGEFNSVKDALQVVGSALRYLTNQCDDMDTVEVPDEDGPESTDTD
jgi:hypothetical protein